MSFHRLDLPAMHISAWDNLKDISDQNFVVVNVRDNELVNFDHFGTHPYLLELDVRDNRICNFLGLTRQVSLSTLHLSGNVIVEHPYYRIMALLVIGYSLKSIDGVDVSEEEILLTQSILSHAALAVSYGWLLDLQPRSPESFQQIISDCQRIRAIHRRRCKGQFTVSHALKRLSEQVTLSDENVSHNEVNRTSSNLEQKRNANNASKQQKEEFASKQRELCRSNIVNTNKDNKHTLHEVHDAEEDQQASVCFTNAEVQTISCFEFDNVSVIHVTKSKEKYISGQWRRCKLQLSNTKLLIFAELQSYQPAIEFALCNLVVEEEEPTILRLTTEGNASVRLEFDSIAQMTAALKCIRFLQRRPLLSSSSTVEQPFHIDHNENNLPVQISQTTQGNLPQHKQETKLIRPDNVCPTHKPESTVDQMQRVNDNNNDKNNVEEIEFEVDELNEEHKPKEETLTNVKTGQNNINLLSLHNDRHVRNGVKNILFCSDDSNNDNVNSDQFNNNIYNNNANDNTRRDIFATHVETNNINSKPNAVAIVNNNNLDNMNDKKVEPQTESVEENKLLAQNAKPVINGKDHSGMKKQIRHRKQKLCRPSVNAQSSSDSSAPSKELSSTTTTELSTANITQSTNALHNNNSSNATPLPAPPISLPRRAADKIKHSLPSSTSSSFLATFPVYKDNLQTTIEKTNINITGNSDKGFDVSKTPEVPATRSVHNSFASLRCNEHKAFTLVKPSISQTQLTNAPRKVLPATTNSSNNTNAVNYQNIITNDADVNDAKSNKITNTNTFSAAVNTAQKSSAHPHHQQLRHQEFRNIVISSDSDEDV